MQIHSHGDARRTETRFQAGSEKIFLVKNDVKFSRDFIAVCKKPL